MKGLPCTRSYVPHQVCRTSLFSDLLTLYNTHDSLTQVFPLEMEFTGEQAVDIGGVSRDAMAAFWQSAFERLFDGNKLLVPVISPHIDMSILPGLGKILSHGYLCTGYLPTQIAFPSFAAIVLGPTVSIAFNAL